MSVRRNVSPLRVTAMAVAFVSACVTSAAGGDDGTRRPVPHRQVLSANPLLMTFEWFNAEYERKFDETKTWGVSTSMSEFGNADYRNLSVLFRYYPQEAALSGFFLGGRSGLHRVSADSASGNFFSAGVDVGYTWLLGSRRNVGVSLGVGANRLFGGDLEDVAFTVPTLRLVNIGVAF